jgi:hypothetical protein
MTAGILLFVTVVDPMLVMVVSQKIPEALSVELQHVQFNAMGSVSKIFCDTTSFTAFPEPLGFVVLCQLAPGLSQPSMTFLFVGAQVCRPLPSDIPSRKCPCLKLVVSVTRICNLIIWTLVLLQGTFTPLVHAHAGRTQPDRSGRARNLGGDEGDLPPLILVVIRL